MHIHIHCTQSRREIDFRMFQCHLSLLIFGCLNDTFAHDSPITIARSWHKGLASVRFFQSVQCHDHRILNLEFHVYTVQNSRKHPTNAYAWQFSTDPKWIFDYNVVAKLLVPRCSSFALHFTGNMHSLCSEQLPPKNQIGSEHIISWY